MNPNFEYIAAVLDDYCDMQTSGFIPTANRYPVADVQEQVALLGQLEQPGNTVLANRIAELERKLSEQTTLVFDLSAERDALSAQVEALRGALYDQLNDCINFDGGKLTDVIMKHSSNVLAATPQHHLRERDAQKGRAGYLQGIADYCEAESKYQDFWISLNADQYADQIRQGGE